MIATLKARVLLSKKNHAKTRPSQLFRAAAQLGSGNSTREIEPVTFGELIRLTRPEIDPHAGSDVINEFKAVEDRAPDDDPAGGGPVLLNH
uniref:Uncharacterized protein n=1 Tax=Plectus sambesii TaxID=2011161 RepID=A0A914X5W1_9BILA